VFPSLVFNEWGPPPPGPTDTTPGALRLSPELFDELVKSAVEQADAAVIAIQCGNENDPVPYKSQREYSIEPRTWVGPFMLSSSAHRAMGVEFYHGRLIMYGLGNSF